MGTLRIVAGRLRGRRIRVPSDPSLRPTSDRVREALFNILGQDLSGWSVLDLYAGSGALGFEAISRGARRAVFIESNPRTASEIRAQAARLGVDRDVRIVIARVEDSLSAGWLQGRFDLVLADPPYGATAETMLAEAVRDSGALDTSGTLVIERESRAPGAAATGPLRLIRTAIYGRTALDFFKFQ
jgi:16S rRNA (guanine966-N2)-methyltransferase